MVLLSFLVELSDELFLSRTRIDLPEHSSPASLARKLEDPFGGIAVSENSARPIRGLFVKVVQRALLKPFVSLRDQLPAVDALSPGLSIRKSSAEMFGALTWARARPG